MDQFRESLLHPALVEQQILAREKREGKTGQPDPPSSRSSRGTRPARHLRQPFSIPEASPYQSRLLALSLLGSHDAIEFLIRLPETNITELQPVFLAEDPMA